MSRIYFDTNIYRHITVAEEVEAVGSLLRRKGVRLLCSAENVAETQAIEHPAVRAAEIDTIVGLRPFYPHYPSSWYHASEVRKTMQRRHPEWAHRYPDVRSVNFFLTAHRERWQTLLRRELPDSFAYSQYRQDVEAGIKQLKAAQRLRREALQADAPSLAFVLADGSIKPLDPAKLEEYWRKECLMVWGNALLAGHPSSRDYFDWVEPYIDLAKISRMAFESFWLREVEAHDVPRNHLLSVVAFFQAEQKISHGNAHDQLHAGYLMDVDLFVTADRAFHSCLVATAAELELRAKIAFVERGETSCMEQLARLF